SLSCFILCSLLPPWFCLWVRVITLENQLVLECQSSSRPDHHSYVWIKSGRETLGETYSSLPVSFHPADRYSCALKGSEEFPSPSVYVPQIPSASVSPSGEIVEGRSVTLTCSSDANPAANYTWYKEDEESPKVSGQNFIITDVRPEHSGNYSCEAQNTRGSQISTVHLVVVRDPSVKIMNIIRLTLVVLMLVPLLISMEDQQQALITGPQGTAGEVWMQYSSDISWNLSMKSAPSQNKEVKDHRQEDLLRCVSFITADNIDVLHDSESLSVSQQP
ncbi:hypothetical protein XENOCAPTIV_011679, partial [Xenoophorus captivus]